VLGLVERGVSEGGRLLLDGRAAPSEQGHFLKPTVLTHLPASSDLLDTEIFGPVLTLAETDTLDQALEVLAKSAYGNAASIYTTSGPAARKFRYEAPAGNI